jgi:hypothetical protein
MQPIELDFKPSRALNLIIVAFTLAVSSIVIAMEMLGQWRWIIMLGIMLYAAYILCQQALLLLPWSYTGVSVNSKNEFYLRCKKGEKILATVKGSTVVTSYLTVIHVKVAQDAGFKFVRQREVVVMPDGVANDEAYRQLRVWLRWGTARNLTKF